MNFAAFHAFDDNTLLIARCCPKYVAGVVEESEEEQNLDEAIDNWMRSSSSAQNEYEILNSLLLEGGETNV